MAITLNDIKKLSLKAKVMIIIMIIIMVGYLDYFYFLSDLIDKRDLLSKKLEETQDQIKDKEKLVPQLNKFKADVAALQETYKVALQKLPDQREIPGLFHSVAQAGKDAGVEFLLFEPKAAIPKMMDKQEPKAAALLKPSDQKQAADSKPTDGKKAVQQKQEPFYEEIPATVSIIGSFQNIVYFFEKVSKLPRIINASDITMGDRKDVKGRGYLINTSCSIKTYMFVDKKEKISDKTK
jgi:type IV pilus assembly protein PilO